LLGAAIVTGDLHFTQVRAGAEEQPIISAIIAAGRLEILNADADTKARAIQCAKSLRPTNRPFIRTDKPWQVVNLSREIRIELRELEFAVRDAHVCGSLNDPVRTESSTVKIIRPHNANV